jgi:hypothetical protein
MKCSECGKDIPPNQQREHQLAGKMVKVDLCEECVEKNKRKSAEYEPEKGEKQ